MGRRKMNKENNLDTIDDMKSVKQHITDAVEFLDTAIEDMWLKDKDSARYYFALAIETVNRISEEKTVKDMPKDALKVAGDELREINEAFENEVTNT